MNTGIQCSPQHEICKEKVDVPTILIKPLQPGGKPKVFVQWFGKAKGISLNEMQFHFPVPVPFNDLCWMGHPECFKVILIGQVNDWPNREAIQEIADSVMDGRLDAWILWVTSSHYGYRIKQDSDEAEPACFVVPMTITLADGVCGIITPQRYCDITVLDRENEKFRRQPEK